MFSKHGLHLASSILTIEARAGNVVTRRWTRTSGIRRAASQASPVGRSATTPVLLASYDLTSWPSYGRDEVNSTGASSQSGLEVGWRPVGCRVVGVAGRRLSSPWVQGIYETLSLACHLQAAPKASAALSHLYGDRSLVSDTQVVRREPLLSDVADSGQIAGVLSRGIDLVGVAGSL